MGAFDSVCRMAADNADIADFVVVYIEESHPTDGWAFPGNYLINKHRTIKDRLAAAAKLAAFPLPANMTLVADTMYDELNLAYGGLYERLYIIHYGKVAYHGERGPFGFRPDEVAGWLSTYHDTLTV